MGEVSVVELHTVQDANNLSVVDIMLGGGRCHFLPNTTDGSCREDDRDITKLAQDSFGWNYIDNREDFDNLNLGDNIKLPLMGLFAEHDIPYEIDRRNMNDVYPSLEEMARTALNALTAATKDSEKGFFLMIEASRIDHAGHGNDPAAQVNEVLAYDRAFATVVEFLDTSAVEGVLVATSDHETGGLAVARRMSISPCFEISLKLGQNSAQNILITVGILMSSLMSPILHLSSPDNYARISGKLSITAIALRMMKAARPTWQSTLMRNSSKRD